MRRRPVPRTARLAGLGLVGAALALAGLPACAPRGNAPATRTDTGFTTADFLPAVGRAAGPRVDALYAPGAQSAFAWLPDGTLWNGDFELALVDADGRPLAFTTPEPGGAHRVLPAARRVASGLDVRAFMPWGGGDGDTTRWTRLAVRVSPGGEAVRFALRSGGGPGHPLHPRAPVGERFRYAFRDGRLMRDGRTLAVIAPAAGAPAGSLGTATAVGADREAGADERVVLAATTAPAGGATWDVWLAPVGGAAANAEPPGRREPFPAAFARTAAAWRAEMARGAAITHPDPRVDAALLSARRLLVGNRERRAGELHFLGNPFQYRDLYLRDGARVVHALGLLGRPDLAAPALESLYAFQWPTGPFLSQRGQLDGTGQALWALAAFAAHGGDARLVDRLLDPALRGARWIALQRASASLRGGPAAGLLPYSDPRDNELARGHLLGSDAWALAGLEALAPLLRARGRGASADSIAAEAAAYRERLVEVWDREARRQGRPLPPVLEGGGLDWGNVAASYPLGVYAPDDPRFEALDAWLRWRGSAEGLLTYGRTDSLHHYLGFDRTQAVLRRGDRRQFLADVDALLDHAQPDGSGFELAARDGGFGDNLPPHGTFAAMFVDLVRSALAYERGDSLVLLAGLPAGERGRPVGHARLSHAPTALGPVDLALTPSPAGTGAVLAVALPAPAIVEWPPPARVRAVRGDRGTATWMAPDRFALPAGAGTWQVEFEPDGEDAP